MRFLINEEKDDSTVVISLRRGEHGAVEVIANDGHMTNILLILNTSGTLSRIGFVGIPYFKIDKEGKIEEEEL